LGFFSDGQGRFGYIKINNHLGNNDLITAFDEALKAQMKTEGLVLDLRNTPSGGNTEVARSIIGHFIDETRSYQIHEVPSLEREFTVPRRFIEQVKPRLPYYDKPVVVLGGHWTGSMGEGLVIGMDAAAGAYTITSDMGDLLGALRNFNMKKSTARVDFGSEALFHFDGTPREDYVADLVVPFSGKTKYKSPILAATAYLEAQAR
jgi:carboxyl-terminal processing protease